MQSRSRRGPERLEGIHPVREALRARRRPVYRLQMAEGAGRPELEEIRRLAREAGVPVATAPRTGPGVPSGARVVLEVGPLPELGLPALIEVGPRWIVALDGVEDPQNLGAIARVADAAGAGALLLTRRHAPPLSPAASRASAGALEHLPVARVPNLRRALEELKRADYWVLAADARAGEALFELPDRLLSGKLVVVLGAEGRGLRRGVADCVDQRAHVPMAGRVASLNVAAAAAVVLFELVRRARVAE